jgi:hypothetical protein
MNIGLCLNTSLFDEIERLTLANKPDIIILPNKIYLNLMGEGISQHCKSILTFEALDLEGIIPNFTLDILSRNETYGIITEIIKNAKILEINERDTPIFARTIIGELPNVLAYNLTPDDLLNKIPARIAKQKEMNIHSFIAIWRAFNDLLKSLKKTPYYAIQDIRLQKLVSYCKENGKRVLVVGDGGKSPIYRRFIQNCVSSGIVGDAVLHSFDIENKPIPNQLTLLCTKVRSNCITESHEVANIVQHLRGNAYKKIGIVSVDKAFNSAIVREFKVLSVDVQHSDGRLAESNNLIRFLSFIIEKNTKEILPLLNIPHNDRAGILKSIVTNSPSQFSLWIEIENLCKLNQGLSHKVELVQSFIQNNLEFIHHSSDDAQNFLEFTKSFLVEVEKLQSFNIKCDKPFFRHFFASWKIWHDNVERDVQVVSIEEAYLKKYDAIILTSKMKHEETGNIIFSEGLRKYFGFAGNDYQIHMVGQINVPTFMTQNCTHLANFAQNVIDVEDKLQYSKRMGKKSIAINKNEAPKTISATALEMLIADPEIFYYRYIKCLKSPEYIPQINLDVGNITHKILEIATQNPQFARNSIMAQFKNYAHHAMFYEKTLNLIIDDIQNKLDKGFKVQAETKFSIHIDDFIITARCDRVDTHKDDITIYDYKSGSSSQFTTSAITKKFEKIQLYIPAIAIYDDSKNIVTKYYFVQNKVSKEISTIITNNLLNEFQDFAKQILDKYLIKCEEITLTKNYYNI